MSETIERPQGAPEREPVTMEDLQRMLDEANGRAQAVEQERDRFRSRLSSLEGELDTERAARTAAEMEREANAARVKTEAERRWDAQKEAVKSNISAQEGALKTARADYAKFAAEGDWENAAEAQERMALAAGELTTYRNQDRFLDSNKESLTAGPSRAPAAPAAPPRRSGDRYGDYIDGELLPAERQWLDARPQFVEDPNYRQRVFAASNFAAQSFVRGSPAYIAEINRIMGEGDTEQPSSRATRQEETVDGGRSSRSTPPRNPAMAGDLPPQRRAGPGAEPTGGGRVRVSLTQDEAEAADAMFGDPNKPQQYIQDPGERYDRYGTLKQRLRDSGRL